MGAHYFWYDPNAPSRAGPYDDTDPHRWRELWSGYADTWTHDPLDHVSRVEATDLVKVLVAYDQAGTDPPEPEGGGDTFGARVARWARNAGLPPELVDSPDAGQELMAVELSGPAWAGIVATSDAELGLVWVNQRGELVARDRAALLGGLVGEDPDAIRVDCEDGRDALGVLVGSSDDGLATRVDAGRKADDAVVLRLIDTDADVRYLPHRYARTDLVLAADTQLVPWARLVLADRADPFPRLTDVELDQRVSGADLLELAAELAPGRALIATYRGRPIFGRVTGWDAAVARDSLGIVLHTVAGPLFGSGYFTTEHPELGQVGPVPITPEV